MPGKVTLTDLLVAAVFFVHTHARTHSETLTQMSMTSADLTCNINVCTPTCCFRKRFAAPLGVQKDGTSYC